MSSVQTETHFLSEGVLNTSSPPDFVSLLRRAASLRRNDVGGIQGGMPSLVAGRFSGVREGEVASREKEKASVGRGKAELFPLQGGSGRLNLKWSLQPCP